MPTYSPATLTTGPGGRIEPVGIEVERVHWQSALVDASVREFFVSLAEAVLIVLAVLWLAMGWRMGIVIGSSILLTILGTFVVMTIFKIDLQRMSLGALVIALGMMVDNSIVVAEGALVRMQQGMDREQAAIARERKVDATLFGATQKREENGVTLPIGPAERVLTTTEPSGGSPSQAIYYLLRLDDRTSLILLGTAPATDRTFADVMAHAAETLSRR